MRAILTWHSLDDSGSPVSMPFAAFARHVECLRRSGVAVVPLERILDPSAPADAVALTFDDGFASFADAWGLLRAAGFPATLFVVTDRAGSDNRWRGVDEPGIPVLPLLGWPELRRLAAEGVALGSHTRTHAWLPALRGAALDDEIGGARERIRAETGQDAVAFAYPYGASSAEAAAAVARHHGLAVTTRHGWLGPREDRRALPRLDAWYFRGSSGLEGFGGPGFRMRVRCRGALRSLRAALGGGYGGGPAEGAARTSAAGAAANVSPERGAPRP